MKPRRYIILREIFFWALIVVFLLLMSNMFIDMWVRGKGFLGLTALFFLLSICIIVFTFRTMKEDRKGKKAKAPRNWKRISLLLTGFSAAGFFVSTILHNLFYAAGILAADIAVLRYAMEGLSVIFFIIGVIVCPLGFIVGAVGNIVISIRQRSKK